MAQRIQIRRDTADNWTNVNPVLAQGEAGYETNTDKIKFGDGTSTWTELDYFSGVSIWGAIDGNLSDQVDLTDALNAKQPLSTRSISTASTATLTPNIDSYDLFVISAQAEDLVIANPTGTAVLGNGFMIDIEDNGSARAITYGNLYTETFVNLPSTTVLGKRMKLVFQYNGTNWELLNVINEQ